MIGRTLDAAISVVSPAWAAKRAHARKVYRSYQGAEANRLNAHKRPVNQSADQELMGPFGADKMRAWARMLVRDNAYAWGVVDTIVSSVVGCGIVPISAYETPEGEDVEDVNEKRDAVFAQWSEVCDINGEYTFGELQAIVQREIVEAGEVLVRIVKTSGKEYRGIHRPVPLALELIEADRLAADKDTYAVSRSSKTRIVRGVEIDDHGKPVAYWIYPEHPSSAYAIRREPERIPANQILHLFRRDRVGQNRGMTWFAPVMQWLRDLGTYVDNELQASAVASCFALAIKSDSPIGPLSNPSAREEDDDGNQYDYLQPGMIMRLRTGESIESANPGRPNSSAEPWITLMLRGISVGTGLSYETVSRDYSKTNYASSRTSLLEDRRRFRCWQRYLKSHLCQPIWDAVCDAAALSDVDGFPDATELLDNRRAVAPVDWQTPEWEWVDPQNEQKAAEDSIGSFMSTYQTELGSRGQNYKAVFYQRAKEENLRRKLGLKTATEQQMEAAMAQQQPAGGSAGGGGAASPGAAGEIAPTGEFAGISTQQWNRNRKAIQKVLAELASGEASETAARVFLGGIGLAEKSVDALIVDAMDGRVDTPEVLADVQ